MPVNEPKPRPLFARMISAFMRMFFRLLYHSFAWTYDLVAATVSFGQWREWVLASVKLLSGPRVLELGFGPGHLQVQLHASGMKAYGIDESAQMARQASRRLTRAGITPQLARGLAQHLPYPTAAFDSVVATFPTLYIVDPLTLAEIRRVLKPGGRLVVLVAAWHTGQSLAQRVMRFVFRVTGESPAADVELSGYVEPYIQAGFQASLRFIELKKSRVMVVIGKK